MTEYEARLRSMVARGVQLVDMTAISGAVFAAKAPRDCLNDPLHPNDYLSRWYAQSLVAALSPDARQACSDGGRSRHNKKGVGDDDPDAPQAIDATGSHWYYNWKPQPSPGSIHAEFVPMLWGAGNVEVDLARRRAIWRQRASRFQRARLGQPRAMSLSNRPSLSGRKLEATGLRLGSPATTTGSPWLDQFMTEAKTKNLRVDFLCLHWYGDITASDPVGDLQKYLQRYWDRYHLPIWLTEFSGADFSFHHRRTTVTDNAQFAAAVRRNAGEAALCRAIRVVRNGVDAGFKGLSHLGSLQQCNARAHASRPGLDGQCMNHSRNRMLVRIFAEGESRP